MRNGYSVGTPEMVTLFPRETFQDKNRSTKFKVLK